MTNNLLSLNDMALFAAIVNYQSFTKAALELGIGKSTASQKLTALENRLEIRLINRTTRSLSLTKAGELLYNHCDIMLQEALLAETNLKAFQEIPSGQLKITCPEISGQLLFNTLLSEFKYQYPKIDIHLIVTDDYLDLIKENIDFSFRTGTLNDSTLICRKISPIPRCLVASQHYLLEHSMPQEPNDLRFHKLLKHSHLSTWTFKKGTETKTIKVKKINFESNSLIFLLNAALNDHGITLLPLYSCAQFIKDHQLMRVLPDWTIPDNQYYLLYPARNKTNTVHMLFLNYILQSSLKDMIVEKEDT